MARFRRGIGHVGRVTGLALVAVPAAVLLLGGCASAPEPALAPVAAAPTTAPTTGATPAPVQSLDADAPEEPAPPARIRIGDLDVDVPVVPVGVDEEGDMDVPLDVKTVGWYRFGPGPGASAGSSVLSGHVDDRVQGRGAFYALSDLGEGDPVQVELADGTVVDYEVRDVERIDKSELPVDVLFARDGDPRITLVTCGGDFDREARSYRENVVVTAEPVGAG